jgi:hypothetical protein
MKSRKLELAELVVRKGRNKEDRMSRVTVSATVISCGFWILLRFIWILTVTTKVIHFTNLQHINFTVESSVRRLLRSALNCFDPSQLVSVS